MSPVGLANSFDSYDLFEFVAFSMVNHTNQMGSRLPGSLLPGEAVQKTPAKVAQVMPMSPGAEML